MCTAPGMTLRSADTSPFEQTRTNVAANPMPIAFSNDVVTASVGHKPSTNRNVGLFLNMPYQNANHVFMSRIILFHENSDKEGIQSVKTAGAVLTDLSI